jgi:predicted ester cyclase
MSEADLEGRYRGYITCLNRQDWDSLGDFVGEGVVYNGKATGLGGYRAMLENDFASIPDLRFNIGLLVADGAHVASRLDFDCSPRGTFMGLAVNGRRVSFAEHVFYAFSAGKIVEVWSLIDRAAIEAQL